MNNELPSPKGEDGPYGPKEGSSVMPERKVIDDWLALYLADPNGTPELLEWLRSPEGVLARAHHAMVEQNAPANVERVKRGRPRLRVIDGGRANGNERIEGPFQRPARALRKVPQQ